MSAKQELLYRAQRDFRPDLITINPAAINDIAGQCEYGRPDIDYWYALNPMWGAEIQGVEKASLFWTLFAAQAFRFWRINDTGQLGKLFYGNETGSNAMLKMIRHSWQDRTAPYPEVSLFREVVRGQPAEYERVAIMGELVDGWDRLKKLVLEMIEASGKRSLGVGDAQMLADAFPTSFEDPYLKKAQLAVGAIVGLAQSGYPEARHAIELTALADYQVPRVLRALSVLQYSPGLAEIVDRQQFLAEGSPEETTIRAATVLAIEEISNRSGLSALAVDNRLWSSQPLAGAAPFHLTATTRY